jgi:hypothetical protein
VKSGAVLPTSELAASDWVEQAASIRTKKTNKTESKILLVIALLSTIFDKFYPIISQKTPDIRQA